MRFLCNHFDDSTKSLSNLCVIKFFNISAIILVFKIAFGKSHNQLSKILLIRFRHMIDVNSENIRNFYCCYNVFIVVSMKLDVS